MKSPHRISLVFFLTYLGVMAYATACQVPVFRYALERWESDPYQVFVVSPKPLDQAETALLTAFKKKSENANVALNIIDTSKVSKAQLWKLPDIDTHVQSTQVSLYAPEKQHVKSSIISFPLTQENLATITQSPVRKKIVQKIIEGNSCVWLIVYGGDSSDAKVIKKKLDTHLKKVESVISIPKGIIGTEERHKINDSTDPEDVLRSSIPLKIAFTSLLVNRNDPAEKALIATFLTHSAPEVRSSSETLIIPVFGRGRFLPPMPASRLSYQAILNGCQYLCGACSCLVKDQNPGFDLLIDEDWSSHLTTGLAVVEKTLPPLDGIGDVIQSKPGKADASGKKSPEGAPRESSHQPLATPSSDFSFIHTLYLVLAGVVVMVVLASVVILRKKK